MIRMLLTDGTTVTFDNFFDAIEFVRARMVEAGEL